MRKVIFTFGLIGGGLLSVFLTVGMVLMSSGSLNFDNGELMGYAGMIVSLSLIFFGIKSYRDNYLKGVISFGKAVQVGLLITLIASLMYAVTWEVYAQTQPESMERFMTDYSEQLIVEARESGTSQAEIDKKIEEVRAVGEMYKNPIIRFGITLIEVLPVGILITLISAALLRKRELLPPEPVVAA